MPTQTPQAKDWNHYWTLDKTKKFTKVSWSKRRISHILQDYIKENAHAMDAGCGSGFFSKYFCDCGLKTVSLDYSDSALNIAREMTEGRTTIVKKDLLRPNLHEEITERFDIIFTDGLFEHFSDEDQDKIMTNFKNVLSPDGVIVTFVPNRWSPWELIRPFYMPGIEEDPFTLRQLRQLNERNHLRVVRQGGLNTLPFIFSPDKLFGAAFGMLLYTIARKN